MTKPVVTGPVSAHLVVRAATAVDIDAIVILERDHLGPDPWSEALVAPGVAGQLPTVGYLVADVDGVVVGHAVISSAGDLAELQRIAVAADHRRRGVARSLVATATARARAAGAERLLLEVRDDNTGARAFYARLGFVELHRRPRYYRDGSTAVVLGFAIDAP